MTSRARTSDAGDGSSLAALTLPAGAVLVRTTPAFDRHSVPAGLLRSHRVARGVWGLLRVHSGDVAFVQEATGRRRTIGAGDVQVIEPDVAHHVEMGDGAVFSVEFHEER